MIKIILKNGAKVTFDTTDIDSWEYDGKMLCVYNRDVLIAMYNADKIISMIVESKITNAKTMENSNG